MGDIARRAPGEARDDAGRPPASRRDLRPRAPSCNISGVGGGVRVAAAAEQARPRPRRRRAPRADGVPRASPPQIRPGITTRASAAPTPPRAAPRPASPPLVGHPDGGFRHVRDRRGRRRARPPAPRPRRGQTRRDRRGAIRETRAGDREGGVSDEPPGDDVEILGLDDDPDVPEKDAEEASRGRDETKHRDKKRGTRRGETDDDDTTAAFWRRLRRPPWQTRTPLSPPSTRMCDDSTPIFRNSSSTPTPHPRGDETSNSGGDRVAFHEKQEREEMAAMRGDEKRRREADETSTRTREGARREATTRIRLVRRRRRPPNRRTR